VAPETLPSQRVRNALTGEWIHSLAAPAAISLSARGAVDSWGIHALTLAAELRYARGGLELRAGYRFYAQTAADFYQAKYLGAPSSYDYVTSDKALAGEVGHSGSIDLGILFGNPFGSERHTRFDLRVEVLHYDYSDFPLLAARTSVFTEIGLRFEP
jgi:hypothetical protein